MPSISAVILTYNKARIFPVFLGTLRKQTLQPSQFIIVDDCSTDGVHKQLATLPVTWKKIILGVNRGQSIARNMGCAAANKEYIIFLDADIQMRPTMLKKLHDALTTHPNASIAYCHYNRSGMRMDPVRAIEFNPSSLERFNYIPMASLVRRKDLPLPPFKPDLRRLEDWELWRTMARRGKKGIRVNEVLFTAHYHDGDLSSKGESPYWRQQVLQRGRT